MGRKTPPRIGEYRHTPGNHPTVGPDGKPRPPRTRRRFPYLGLVFLAYGMVGPLVCAAVPVLMAALGLRHFMPTRFSDLPLPPSPSLDNVLFGAGAYDLALACGLAGFWLWRSLWRLRLPEEAVKGGVRGVLPSLLAQAAALGPAFALAALPIVNIGLFLRTGPTNIPWLVKPFFALLAMPMVTITALLTGVVPLVLVLLGLFMGALTAVVVAFMWQRFPEEADLR
jgi:hypothetical protein